MREKWTPRQKNIYDGLSSIGEEISGFYEAGLKILYENCPNAAYFLMHSAREISCGLRSIFGVDNPLKNGEGNHKNSILFSLGEEKYSELGEDWYKVSCKFHKFAHRHGPWKKPIELNEVINLWEEFEVVLEKLVGSYYSIIDRIEHIGRLKTLEGGPFEVLCNILEIPFYSNYFFRKEFDPKWFPLLKERLYFAPIRIEFDENGNALFWNILDYLGKISEQVEQNSQYGKELIEVIQDIVQFSSNTRRVNNPHIWWYCVKILNNLPFSIIQENLSVEQFRAWLFVIMDVSLERDLAVHDISEKLLPKFLADEYPADFAEAIIDIITRIEAKKEPRRGFNRGEAKLVWDSYWILQAFSKNSERIARKCTVQSLLGIADKLNDALKQKQQSYSTNIILNETVLRVEVSRIHADDKKTEFVFKDDIYRCEVMGFSDEQLKSIDWKNDHFSLHAIGTPAKNIADFVITANDKDSFDAEFIKGLPQAIKWKEDKDFVKKIEYLFEGLYSDYSYIWFNKSLASGGGEHASSAEVVLTIILRDVLLIKCQIKPDEGVQILDQLLTSKYRFPHFKRFVLLCIDRFWNHYPTFLEKVFKVVPDALDVSDLDVELYDVFMHHNEHFSPSLVTRIKEMINHVPEYYVNKGENLTAYWKYRWLSPLKQHKEFSKLYDDAKSKADLKEDKSYTPDRETIKGGWVTHMSPLSKEELLEKPIVEIVKYLSEFQEMPDPWQRRMDALPDKDGLGDTLQSAVKENPKKFTDEMDEFFEMDYFYLHRIMRGLKDAWNDSKDIDWERILSFGVKYFDRDNNLILKEALRAQGEDSGEGRYIWMVEIFVDLIADGSRNDARAFEPRYFDLASRIFELIIPLLKGEMRPDTQRDALTYAINNTLGRVVMDYISFSLRVSRSTEKKVQDWGNTKYERFFTIGIDAYIWFGRYLPQMKYLDENYTKQKIKQFEEMKSEDFEWQMFMEGYLTGSQIYRDLYQLMRGNYIKALETNVFDGQVDRKLVEHLSIGYINIYDLLQPKNDDGRVSLLWKMLTESGQLGKSDRWVELAGFFWSITGRMERKKNKNSENVLSEKEKGKIEEFWRWAFDNQVIVKSNLGENYGSFWGRMAELTIILEKIDEEKEQWLLLCAPHIDRHRNVTFFVEYLAKFEDQESVRRIGKIFNKILEHTTPTFKQEDIELIVQRIYEKGSKQDADEICNTYGRRGLHFLKPYWEKNQKKV